MAQIQHIQTGNAIVQAALDRYWGGGYILWVGNRSGLPAGTGESMDSPLSSLFGATGALAKLQATTSRGHVIFGLGGHAESVTTADMGSLQGAANAFAFVGLGGKTTKPAFTWTAAGATWLMDTADNVIDNCRLFLAGPHAAGSALTVAAPMAVSGDGCAIRNCDIFFGFDADQIITVGINVTGDEFTFENNTCICNPLAAIADTGTFLRLTGADRAVIRKNYIAGSLVTATDGLIEFTTTLSSNVVIEDNFIFANGSGDTCAIDAGTALVHTGKLQRNLLRVSVDGTAGTVVFTVHATSNFTLLDNFLVNNLNERGLVVGTASV